MIKNIFTCLQGALIYAAHPCKYIPGNPCVYVKLPKIEVSEDSKTHTEYICVPEDYEKIMQRFPKGNAFHLPLLTGHHCGTLIGETYGIDLLNNVDFETHTLHIRHQLKKERVVWVYRSPKYDFCTLNPNGPGL